jgi:GMP synthase-like glutamine amidotransferase
MEGPGHIAVLARELGFRIEEYPLFEREPPEAVPPGDLLVVMGGPMGVADIGDPRWPFLQPEVKLLTRSLREGRAVLGVCLGAQLMAHALGARVYPLHVGSPPVRLREVGWGPVAFAPAGSDRALDGTRDAEVVLHWHGDTFDLPEGAVLLASTLQCPNQMFRFGACAYAVQFHIELVAGDVARWVREDADFVATANGPGGADRILEETERYVGRYREMGDRMIRNVLTAARECGT